MADKRKQVTGINRAMSLSTKYVIWIIILIATLFLSALLLKVTIENRQKHSFSGRIIILGLDAVSPEILEPMMDQGELPNFNLLREKGSYHRLSTTNPPQSPVAWSGFSTGQNPGKNGIFDFILRDPDTYKLYLSLFKMEHGKPVRTLKSKTFWQYLSESNIPSVIIACPVTFPPGKIRGKMLSGMGVPDLSGHQQTYTFYTSEAIRRNIYLGGRVFHVDKAPVMIMDLLGPKVALINKRPDDVKVPFRVKLEQEKKVLIEYQNESIELEQGQWSNWCEVEFKLGLFKRAKGIFKFCLISIEPEFKLYISPINFDPRSPLFDISHPKGYSKELFREIGFYHTQGMPMDMWALNQGRLSDSLFQDEVKNILNEKRSMLNYEMSNFKKGLLFCYFESLDVIQHMYWRYIDIGHSLYEGKAPDGYKTLIKKWYKKFDSVLGDVISQLKPNDTLIVLSDHGFGNFRRAVHLNTWLKDNGYLVLKDGCIIGRDSLVDVDWDKTKAYALGYGAIYINQKGRERFGIVEKGAEADAIKEEICKKIEQLIDTKHNQPIVSKAYDGKDIFIGKYADLGPDIYIGFNKGYRASWKTAFGGEGKGVVDDNLQKWSGSHLFDPALVPGVILSNRKIKNNNPSIYDIAPTVLKITGSSQNRLDKCDFDGKPLLQ